METREEIKFVEKTKSILCDNVTLEYEPSIKNNIKFKLTNFLLTDFFKKNKMKVKDENDLLNLTFPLYKLFDENLSFKVEIAKIKFSDEYRLILFIHNKPIEYKVIKTKNIMDALNKVKSFKKSKDNRIEINICFKVI